MTRVYILKVISIFFLGTKLGSNFLPRTFKTIICPKCYHNSSFNVLFMSKNNRWDVHTNKPTLGGGHTYERTNIRRDVHTNKRTLEGTYIQTSNQLRNFFYRQTDKQTNRQTDKPTDRPIDRQTDRQTELQTYIWEYRSSPAGA